MVKNKFEERKLEISDEEKIKAAIANATDELANLILKKQFFHNNLLDRFMDLNDNRLHQGIKDIFIKMENSLAGLDEETIKDQEELRWRVFKLAKKQAIESYISKKGEFPADNLIEDYIGYLAEEIAAMVVEKSESIGDIMEQGELIRQALKEKLHNLQKNGINLNKLGGRISEQAEECIKEQN
ncbi:hypothetical protein A2303_07485 [Candidatus Falkowbacteria bacterium RIFOXYB2_FULL_47_14]|uniref:Uncharacterized protein n=1 Tax=Candidatus Falkowbacteria bacterium RIFOXYA2_FULL_47_19 TaxID=1797994 RepID=A0A1F5SGF9_9BACT|nr:MAG: hypothetical protein A2227_01235 [Candidatus Falkowbacteria bacterium RIFOXYA2_FULL_47_19]OGF34988.1 MAG: hypothetical protein A2468_07190 [Candidatus Falkowbacteria bacterium RIFOXYC2_FULL_46_15]OGF43703.1 MAG: hypothetical protein A2303_07485 [Candidatus Falkowbacteria bacterium RIFOXYB2_FULL_47_14]